ncbi:hypothetical protein N7U66_09055 [Lacinutrix neustonica]|uniref:Calx-beta domain-containing protein n=1 Tax=Lacinutrix neustonica TaxID=2980107 RepID=A0A9E8MYA8_9FLAO|nr:hypothetical protein [Lacinutrix neustonica]WAC03596.1 hypothetical protein N7U66_09055 [Lacinutrix neustonica]
MKKIKYLLSFSLLALAVVGCENTDPADIISEDAKPIVSYEIGSTAATELGMTEVVVNITMDKPIKSSTRFTITQIGGDAVAGEDYMTADAVVPPYATQAQIVVSVLRDLDQTEGTETAEFSIDVVGVPDTYEVIHSEENFTVTIEDYTYCFRTLEATDAYGDGWNGGFITVTADGTSTEYAAQDNDGQVNLSETTVFDDIAIGDGSAFSITYTSVEVLVMVLDGKVKTLMF